MPSAPVLLVNPIVPAEDQPGIEQVLVEISDVPDTGECNQLSLRVSTKRRREFIAGRTCARIALERLNQATLVRIGTDRAPVWPDGTVGSISHSNQFAWAAVALRSPFESIGVDVEEIGSPESMSDIENQIVTSDESRLLNNTKPLEGLTIAFSAKESLYKAVYQLGMTDVDFKDITISGITEDRVYLSLNCTNRTTFSANYALRDKHVFTMVCINEESPLSNPWT